MQLLDFYSFIYDRQEIWHKKEFLKLPPPWTEDEILQTYKFCNCYRELDRCSQHLIKWVISAKMPVEDKIFNIILFRFFNIDGFFKNIGWVATAKSYDWLAWQYSLDSLKEEGATLFNLAYRAAPVPYDKSHRPGDKHVQILMLMRDIAKNIKPLRRKLENAKTLQEAHQWLWDIKLFGGFFAYQVLTDLTYIPGFLSQNINSYVHVGPGAEGGIDLLQSPRQKKLNYEDFCKHLFHMQAVCFPALYQRKGKQWMNVRYGDAYYQSPYLSLSNIQNCLCEFRKYHNLKNNPRARKRYYKGVNNGIR
jgi:hypothetical protein